MFKSILKLLPKFHIKKSEENSFDELYVLKYNNPDFFAFLFFSSFIKHTLLNPALPVVLNKVDLSFVYSLILQNFIESMSRAFF